MMNPEPTPYDTGERCEATPWIPYGSEVDQACLAQNFGKVDFDDDSGETVCVVYVFKGPGGRHTVHVEALTGDDEIQVELALEKGTFLIRPESLG